MKAILKKGEVKALVREHQRNEQEQNSSMITMERASEITAPMVTKIIHGVCDPPKEPQVQDKGKESDGTKLTEIGNVQQGGRLSEQNPNNMS